MTLGVLMLSFLLQVYSTCSLRPWTTVVIVQLYSPHMLKDGGVVSIISVPCPLFSKAKRFCFSQYPYSVASCPTDMCALNHGFCQQKVCEQLHTTQICKKTETCIFSVTGMKLLWEDPVYQDCTQKSLEQSTAAHKINLMRHLIWFNSQFNSSKQVIGLPVKHQCWRMTCLMYLLYLII